METDQPPKCATFCRLQGALKSTPDNGAKREHSDINNTLSHISNATLLVTPFDLTNCVMHRTFATN